MSRQSIADEIVAVCRRLYDRGLIAGQDGNENNDDESEHASRLLCGRQNRREEERWHEKMLLLKLRWTTAQPIRSARDLARFLHPQGLYSIGEEPLFLPVSGSPSTVLTRVLRNRPSHPIARYRGIDTGAIVTRETLASAVARHRGHPIIGATSRWVGQKGGGA